MESACSAGDAGPPWTLPTFDMRVLIPGSRSLHSPSALSDRQPVFRVCQPVSVLQITSLVSLFQIPLTVSYLPSKRTSLPTDASHTFLSSPCLPVHAECLVSSLSFPQMKSTRLCRALFQTDDADFKASLQALPSPADLPTAPG